MVAPAVAGIAGMSLAKFKLLEKMFKNLEGVGKNAAPLNDMFQSMKEGSMMTAPYTTFLKLLGAATTKESAESIKRLFGLLKEPSTKAAIELLSKSFAVIVEKATDAASAVLNLASAIVELGTKSEGVRVKTKLTWEDLFDNLATFLRILGLISDKTEDFGGRREGMGEGYVPYEGRGYYEGGGGR